MPSSSADTLPNYDGGTRGGEIHIGCPARHSRVNGVPSNTSGGFHFFSYDAENILNATTDNVTGVNTDKRPTRLFQNLKNNAEFRTLIADRIHALFFNDGALTPTATAARYRKDRTEVDPSVIAESARCGDYRNAV